MSSAAAVIDALVALAQTTFPSGVTVSDGEPVYQLNSGITYLMVGVETGDTESGPIDEGPIGAMSMWEQYTVGCRIFHDDGDRVQKTARDAAASVYSRFLAAVQADPGLNGTISSGWIRPVALNYTQTTAADLEAGATGRSATFDLTFTVRNLLQL
jgi:hypothetical protein